MPSPAIPTRFLPDRILDPSGHGTGARRILPASGHPRGRGGNLDLQRCACVPSRLVQRNSAHAAAAAHHSCHPKSCFSNCRELSRLELSDSIETWGSGIFSGCCKLLTFHIHCSGPACSATAVWQIAVPLPAIWDITVDGSGGPFRLIFPEYEEYEEENLITQAVLFSFHISGAGYPYHHCFTGRTLDLFRYDSTWREFMALNYQPLDAVRIAFWRLFYPVGLLEQHQAAYLQFLRSHTDLALTWLTQTRNSDGLSFLLSQTEPEKDALRRACTLARTLSYTQGAAILLEALHQRFPAAQTPAFDL